MANPSYAERDLLVRALPAPAPAATGFDVVLAVVFAAFAGSAFAGWLLAAAAFLSRISARDGRTLFGADAVFAGARDAFGGAVWVLAMFISLQRARV
jgi:hypothetical protein